MAQCAMCKASLETSTENTANVGTSLNTGILYLMTVPYVMLTIIGVLIYRSYKRRKAALENASLDA